MHSKQSRARGSDHPPRTRSDIKSGSSILFFAGGPSALSPSKSSCGSGVMGESGGDSRPVGLSMSRLLDGGAVGVAAEEGVACGRGRVDVGGWGFIRVMMAWTWDERGRWGGISWRAPLGKSLDCAVFHGCKDRSFNCLQRRPEHRP
jgi:hypothetical protein